MRTTAELVGGIIEVDVNISLDPFLTTASTLVDDVELNDSSLTDARLELIERWLAAHFYCMRDPRAVSERAGPVSATYQSKVDLRLNLSHYGQMAIILDTSGYLRSLSSGRITPSVTWVGTTLT